MREHVLKSINAAKRLGNIYSPMYRQYVLAAGIALRMANADKKMSKGKLMLGKNMKHVD